MVDGIKGRLLRLIEGHWMIRRRKWRYCFCLWIRFCLIILIRKGRRCWLRIWRKGRWRLDRRLLLKVNMVIKCILLKRGCLNVIKIRHKVRRFWRIINLETVLDSFVFFIVQFDRQLSKLRLMVSYFVCLERFISI